LKTSTAAQKQINGRTVPPLLSTDALKRQTGSFRNVMQKAAPTFMQRHEAACQAAQHDNKPALPPAIKQFWNEIGCMPSVAATFPEFIRLVQIAMVMVGGSVQDERVFSTLAFIKNDLRSCLLEEHLDACLVLYTSKDAFTLSSFPYRKAYDEWFIRRMRLGVGAADSDDGAGDSGEGQAAAATGRPVALA
jgi:hypothetical protein